MQIFAGVREIWGVKQESGRLRYRLSYVSLAIFSESSSQGWNYYILIYSPLLASHLHGNGWPWMTWNCCSFEFSLFVNESAQRWEYERWPEEPRDCWLAAVLWIGPPARPAVGEVICRGSGDMGRQTRKWSYKHDKHTQCCRAFTLALARLSCFLLKLMVKTWIYLLEALHLRSWGLQNKHVQLVCHVINSHLIHILLLELWLKIPLQIRHSWTHLENYNKHCSKLQ